MFELFVEGLKAPSMPDDLERVVNEAIEDMRAGRGGNSAYQAFSLGLLALAWDEARNGSAENSRTRELEDWVSVPSRRGLLANGPSLVAVAAASDNNEQADAFASWFRESLDPTPAELIPILPEWVAVKRRLLKPGEADALLRELERLLTDVAEDDSILEWQQQLTIGPARVRALLLRAEEWSALGVLGQASTFASRGLNLAHEQGSPLNILAAYLTVANVLLASARNESALAVLDVYLATKPDIPLDQRRQVERARCVALSELERLDPTRERQAAALLRELAAASDDRHGVRSRLDLADVLLRDHVEAGEHAGQADSPAAQEARRVMTEAKEILAQDGGVYSTSDELGGLLASHEARLALATTGLTPTGKDVQLLEERLSAVAEAFDALLLQRQRVPARPGGIGFLHLSYRRMLISTFIQLEIKLRGDADGTHVALQRLLDVQGAGQLAQQLNAPQVRLDERAQWLDEGHGVLLYFPARYVVHVFAFDAEHLVHHQLAAHVTFRGAQDRFIEALDSSPTDIRSQPVRLLQTLRKESRALSASLLPEPLHDLVRSWSTLTVVGGEYFSNLPFESLSLTPDGPLLGTTHAVENTPSLAVSLVGASRQGAAREQDLVLAATLQKANPQIATNRAELAIDKLRAIADNLSAPFRKERRRQLVGEQATWSAVQRNCASGAAVLHLLAHGGYDHNRERGACLILSPEQQRDDGLVFVEDVEQASLPVNLVLLSACGTARGPERLGSDNLQHLGGAFLRAGAASVILTRADVTLEEAVALADAIQKAYLNGASAGEALRLARVAAAREGGPLGAYLAGRFQLLGWGSNTFQPTGD